MTYHPKDFSYYYSEVSKKRNANAFKKFYKYLQQPGVVNAAGGMPHVKYFPFDTLEAKIATSDRDFESAQKPQAASSRVLVPKVVSDPDKNLDLAVVLQYGAVQGTPLLFAWIKNFVTQNLHTNVPYEGGVDITLSCGNTDGYNKVLETLSNEWSEDKHPVSMRQGLLVEQFTFTSPITSTKARGLNVVSVETDFYGVLPHVLESTLANWDHSKGKRPHLFYTISLGQNPTGGITSIERRREIYQICQKYDIIIIEDEPYWFLQFDIEKKAEPLENGSGFAFLDSLSQSYLNIDVDGRVLRLDTFSKNVAPGSRMGWITGQPEIIERILRYAENSTQQPSGFVQSMVYKMLSEWTVAGFVSWLENLRDAYEERRDYMCSALDKYKTSLEIIEYGENGAKGVDAWGLIRKEQTGYGESSPEGVGEWGLIKKQDLYSFHWPKAGMFIWVRINYELHPLYGMCSLSDLSTALWVYLIDKPNLVAVSPGLTFSGAEDTNDKAMFYFRLCFAAAETDQVGPAGERFGKVLHQFFKITDVQIIKDLLPQDDINITMEKFREMLWC